MSSTVGRVGQWIVFGPMFERYIITLAKAWIVILLAYSNSILSVRLRDIPKHVYIVVLQTGQVVTRPRFASSISNYSSSFETNCLT